MSFIKKIQNQSEQTRKIIFWITIVIVAALLFFAWIFGVKQKFEQVRKDRLLQDLSQPKLQEQWENMPEFNMPEFPELSEEELKLLEEELKKLEEDMPTEETQ
ncbi:hypothetical protein ACFL06_01740 [Patescibacteria group bacterium]